MWLNIKGHSSKHKTLGQKQCHLWHWYLGNRDRWKNLRNKSLKQCDTKLTAILTINPTHGSLFGPDTCNICTSNINYTSQRRLSKVSKLYCTKSWIPCLKHKGSKQPCLVYTMEAVSVKVVYPRLQQGHLIMNWSNFYRQSALPSGACVGIFNESWQVKLWLFY